MNTNNKGKKIGECEASLPGCLGADVEVVYSDHNMWLCKPCFEKEKKVGEQTAAAKAFLAHFKEIDQSIKLVTDLHNAATPAIVDLRAAIFADESVPVERKEYVFCEHAETHVKTLDDAIFQRRKELEAMENERRAWQTNGQTAAGKLSEELQKRFKIFDVNYRPQVVKTPKPKAVPTPKVGRKTQNKLVREMADKYGVPHHNVMMGMVGTNKSAEEVAKELAAEIAKFKARIETKH